MHSPCWGIHGERMGEKLETNPSTSNRLPVGTGKAHSKVKRRVFANDTALQRHHLIPVSRPTAARPAIRLFPLPPSNPSKPSTFCNRSTVPKESIPNNRLAACSLPLPLDILIPANATTTCSRGSCEISRDRIHT